MIKRRTTILLLFVCLFTLSLVWMAHRQSTQLERDPIVLLNKYYLFKEVNPAAAKAALHIVITQNPNHLVALKELSQIYIREGDQQHAIPLLQRLITLEPHNERAALQLAYLYHNTGQWDKAAQLLKTLANQPGGALQIEARLALKGMNSHLPEYRLTTTNTTPLPSQIVRIQDSDILVPTMFLNWFYSLQHYDKKTAHDVLKLLLTIDPQNTTANLEMAYYELKQEHDAAAIHYFNTVYLQKPTAQLALQLGYLYAKQKKINEAQHYFLIASQQGDAAISPTARKAYELTQIPGASAEKLAELSAQPATLVKPVETVNTWLDRFYAAKKTNEEEAWGLIQQIIRKYPDNVLALKEGGYLAISKKNSCAAIDYFTRAYNLTQDTALAMQLGYLYAQTPTQQYIAYQYFKKATSSDDAELALRAQQSMTNLAGAQTRIWPDPFFNEINFEPFTQSRFGLTVASLVTRFGVEANNSWQNKAYLVYRRTQDNKSANAGQLPQIYEDNVAITGVGTRLLPFPTIPMIAYIEIGEAYDLVDRDRKRWRGDVRGGFMYYNEFGARPSYFDKPTMNMAYYSNWYADATYFSRYDNNVIATLRTHQGIRAFQYHSSMINLYGTARVLQDTRREFFNNIFEVGPGISWVPSNRYNVLLRFEHIAGTYLPAGGSFNPYGKHYTNNIVQLLVYITT